MNSLKLDRRINYAHHDAMSTFMPVPNVALVTLHFSLPNSRAQIQFHHRRTYGTWTKNELIGLCDLWGGWWQLLFVDLFSWGLYFERAYAIDLSSRYGLYGTGTRVTHVPGRVPEAPMSANVAIYVQLVTSSARRAYRGRQWHPGAPLSALLPNGTVNPDYASGLKYAYDRSIAGFRAVAPVVTVSRIADGENRYAALISDVNYVSVNVITGQQRRRMPKPIIT